MHCPARRIASERSTASPRTGDLQSGDPSGVWDAACGSPIAAFRRIRFAPVSRRTLRPESASPWCQGAGGITTPAGTALRSVVPPADRLSDSLQLNTWLDQRWLDSPESIEMGEKRGGRGEHPQE